MAAPPPGPEPHSGPDDVARDLAAIEARLKTAQAELEAVTNERREALERLGRLHADRMAEEANGHRPAGGQHEPPETERQDPP
jgi:hypothetical protein